MPEPFNPTQEQAAKWLKQVDRAKARESWILVNNRLPGFARAVRPFLQNQFPDENQRQAALEGLCLALFTMYHFEDIHQLNKLYETTPEKTKKQGTKATE